MRHADLKDTPNLIVTILRQVSSLVQGEIQLAKAEMSTNLSRAGVGLRLIAVAALLALVALNVLAAALVGYLATTGLTPGMAALLVGGALIFMALVLMLVGKSRLSADALAPRRTAANLRRDVEEIREGTHA